MCRVKLSGLNFQNKAFETYKICENVTTALNNESIKKYIKLWNNKATHPYQKNAGEIGGWWIDKKHFTSSRDSGTPLELVGGGSGKISGAMFTLTGDGLPEFSEEGFSINGVIFKPVPLGKGGAMVLATGDIGKL